MHLRIPRGLTRRIPLDSASRPLSLHAHSLCESRGIGRFLFEAPQPRASPFVLPPGGGAASAPAVQLEASALSRYTASEHCA